VFSLWVRWWLSSSILERQILRQMGRASELFRDWSCAGSLLLLFCRWPESLMVFFPLLLTVLGTSVDGTAPARSVAGLLFPVLELYTHKCSQLFACVLLEENIQFPSAAWACVHQLKSLNQKRNMELRTRRAALNGLSAFYDLQKNVVLYLNLTKLEDHSCFTSN